MPTNRKRRQKTRAMDQFCHDELLTGPCLLAGCGYFDYSTNECDTERMRNDWSHYRDSLLSTWIAEHPGSRPYAWWQFDAPEPLPANESQRDYLKRHKLTVKADCE